MTTSQEKKCHQERAIRTRNRIIRAAAVVFDRQGYEVASIADIMREADVTKGALYFHFASKDALARVVMEAQVSLVQVRERSYFLQSAIDLTTEVGVSLQTDPIMKAGIRLTIEHGTWKTTKAGPYLSWIQLTESLLRQARERGELLPHVDPREAAELVVGAFTGIQLLSEVLCHRQDILRRLAAYWDCVLPGLAAPGVLTQLETYPAPGRELPAATDLTLAAPQP